MKRRGVSALRTAMQINAFRIRARPMSAVGADCGGERAPDWALNYFKVMQWEREARPVMRMDYTTARYKPPRLPQFVADQRA